MHRNRNCIRAVLLSAILSLIACGARSQELERLPPEVNSEKSEVAPVISPDGKTLYLARPRMALDSSTIVDIWFSRMDSLGRFRRAEIMGGELGSRFGIAVTSVAPDNNTLFLMGKMDEDTPPEDRIYVTHRTKTGWAIPESIHIENLRVRGLYTDYTFGPDEKTLIMSMERDSALGGRDLYVSFLEEVKNRWSTPLWLGPDINSAYNEMTPFLSADGKTLYFSSNRPGGYGEVDVYRTVRQDDGWQHWSAPENMGPRINHGGRTLYYTEDAKGEYAYFVWRENTHSQTDIFRTLVPKQKASVVALVRGRVLDSDGRPLAAKIRYERLSDGAQLGIAHSDPNTGDYQITLPAGADYAVRAQKSGYVPTSEHIDLTALHAFLTLDRDLFLSAIRKGALVRLNSIFFETDKATLLPPSYPELDHLKDLLVTDSIMRISIEGHTDSVGSREHNMTLSRNRAEAVKDYLVRAGIAPGRLEVAAFGPTKPISDNTTDDGRSKNRRVEFRILSSKAVEPSKNDDE